MKTCSYRGAQPRSENEGLFCSVMEPEARYMMQPCKKETCSCCRTHNHTRNTEPWQVVNFMGSSKHQFSNGYTTYLNCPAVIYPLLQSITFTSL